MTKREKAPIGAATPTEAKERDMCVSISRYNSTSFSGSRQAAAYLLHGQENAIPARELANLMGYADTRPLRLAVERARREGVLILSSDAGYFLPSLDEAEAEQEIQRYVHRVDARMKSNRLSVRACKRYLRRCRSRECAGGIVLMNDEALYRAWISTVHFTDWDDLNADIVSFGDMTLDEVKQLMELSLVRGHEVIVMRQADGDDE